MNIEVTTDFKKQLRKLDVKLAQRVATQVDAVAVAFGHPPVPHGLGVKSLQGIDAFELRVSGGLRVIFTRSRETLLFHTIGNHEDVRAWIASHRKRYKN